MPTTRTERIALPKKDTVGTVVIRAYGEPKGQPRPRAFAKNGSARVYDPGTAEEWKSAIASAAREQLPPNPFGVPVRICIDFYMPRPKNHYRTGKREGEMKPGMPFIHAKKPDIDNLQKAVLDCLSQLNAWTDDSLVFHVRANKHYHEPGERPGAEIRIYAEREER